MLIKQVRVKLIKHQQQNKKKKKKKKKKKENNQCTAYDYQHLTAKVWNQLRVQTPLST